MTILERRWVFRKLMDFRRHVLRPNFFRIWSYVKPLKPRTRDAVLHTFSWTRFKTAELCNIDSISLKSFIFSVKGRHSGINWVSYSHVSIRYNYIHAPVHKQNGHTPERLEVESLRNLRSTHHAGKWFRTCWSLSTYSRVWSPRDSQPRFG